MIESTPSEMEKAFIALLYETGARIGEVGSMKIGSISFDDKGAIVQLEGKTGKRPARVITSVNYLKDWLKYHPKNKNKLAHLWLNHKGMMMTYAGFKLIIAKLAKRANIKKKHNPHAFRHAR